MNINTLIKNTAYKTGQTLKSSSSASLLSLNKRDSLEQLPPLNYDRDKEKEKEKKLDSKQDIKPTVSNIPPSLIPIEDHIIYQRDNNTSDLNITSNNFPSSFPNSRRDVNILEDWLSKKLAISKLLKYKLTKLNTLKSEYNIYHICIHEIMRQVTTSCYERGMLMNYNITQIDDIFNNLLLQIQEVENKCTYERELRDKISLQMDSTIASFDNERIALNSKIKQLEADYDKLNLIVSKFHEMTEINGLILPKAAESLGLDHEEWTNLVASSMNKTVEKNLAEKNAAARKKKKAQDFTQEELEMKEVEQKQEENEKQFGKLHSIKISSSKTISVKKELELLEREKKDLEERSISLHKLIDQNRTLLTGSAYTMLEAENVFLLHLVADLRDQVENVNKSEEMSKAIQSLLTSKRELEDKLNPLDSNTPELELPQQKLEVDAVKLNDKSASIVEMLTKNSSIEVPKVSARKVDSSANTHRELTHHLEPRVDLSRSGNFVLSTFMNDSAENKFDIKSILRKSELEDPAVALNVTDLQRKLGAMERVIWTATADFACETKHMENFIPLKLDYQYWLQRQLEAEVIFELLNKNNFVRKSASSDLSIEQNESSLSFDEMAAKEVSRWLKHRNFLLARNVLTAEHAVRSKLSNLSNELAVEYDSFHDDITGFLMKILNLNHIAIVRKDVLTAAVNWVSLKDRSITLVKELDIPSSLQSGILPLRCVHSYAGQLAQYVYNSNVDKISIMLPNIKPINWLLSNIAKIYNFAYESMNHFNIELFIDQHYDKQLYSLASYSSSSANNSLSFRLLSPKYLTGKLNYIPLYTAAIEKDSEVSPDANLSADAPSIIPTLSDIKVLPPKNKKTDPNSKAVNPDIDYSPQLKPIFENVFLLTEFISSFVSVLQSTSSCYMSYLLDSNDLGRIIYNFAQLNSKNAKNTEEYLMELLSTIHLFREHPRVDLFCQFLNISTVVESKNKVFKDIIARERMTAKQKFYYQSPLFPKDHPSIKNLLQNTEDQELSQDLSALIPKLRYLTCTNLPKDWLSKTENHFMFYSIIRRALLIEIDRLAFVTYMKYIASESNLIIKNSLEMINSALSISGSRPNFQNIKEFDASNLPIILLTGEFDKFPRNKVDLTLSLLVPFVPARHITIMKQRLQDYFKDQNPPQLDITESLSCINSNENINIDTFLSTMLEIMTDSSLTDTAFLYSLLLKEQQSHLPDIKDEFISPLHAVPILISVLSSDHSLAPTNEIKVFNADLPNSLNLGLIPLSLFQSKFNTWFPEISDDMVAKCYNEIVSNSPGGIIDQVEFTCVVSSLFGWQINASSYLSSVFIALSYQSIVMMKNR